MRSKSTHHQNYTSSNTNSINHGQLSNTHSTNSHPRLTERYSIDSIINNSKNSAIIIPKDVHSSAHNSSNSNSTNKRVKSRFAKISYGIGSVSIGIMFLLGFVVHQRFQSNNINTFSSSNS